MVAKHKNSNFLQTCSDPSWATIVILTLQSIKNTQEFPAFKILNLAIRVGLMKHLQANKRASNTSQFIPELQTFSSAGIATEL